MPITAATAPVTIAGTLLVGNAQVLSLITVVQMVYPGAPTIYSFCPMAMDVKGGAMGGAFPDATLASVGGVQLARYYGLPSLVGGWGSAAKIPDEQAAYEKALSALPMYLAGADLTQGIGLLENFMTSSYEQILIDYEIHSIIRKISHGMYVDDVTLALDAIWKVGHKGHFLAEKHTLQHLNECWIPVLTDARPYEEWKASGAKSITDVAREKVKQILATHEPEPLDPDTTKQLTVIIKEAEKSLRP
jgi:trimethylamine--corrinoid protein Co-methyltransferase